MAIHREFDIGDRKTAFGFGSDNNTLTSHEREDETANDNAEHDFATLCVQP